jgi:hypothetical protein
LRYQARVQRSLILRDRAVIQLKVAFPLVD